MPAKKKNIKTKKTGIAGKKGIVQKTKSKPAGQPAKKSRKERNFKSARVHVSATFNNTIVTFADLVGGVICWGSSGSAGFKGARKSTPFAATATVEKAAAKAKSLGVEELEVYIKGPGPGRDAALRALRSVGFKMSVIADVTPIPHNGPRPKKRRRM